jgi:hypothetical protein
MFLQGLPYRRAGFDSDSDSDSEGKDYTIEEIESDFETRASFPVSREPPTTQAAHLLRFAIASAPRNAVGVGEAVYRLARLPQSRPMYSGRHPRNGDPILTDRMLQLAHR